MTQVITSEFENVLTTEIDAQGLSLVYEILQNRLYTEKILAVVRETTCNARDSHTESGNPDPIYVHLPTRERPFFEVTDWGTGLSPERFDRAFRKYGSSTKRASESEIGQWGIGSKSPFCYTTSFTITTVHKGIKYIYAAYLDDNKVGSFPLMDEFKADEPNGTTISIPVRLGDIDRFTSDFARVTQYWKLQPRTNLSVKYPEETLIVEGRDWKYFEERNSLRVLVGEICYPVNKAVFNNCTPHLSNRARRFLEQNVVIEFPNKELELAVNRESLQYTQETIERLVNRLNQIPSEIEDLVQKKIESLEDLKEAIDCLYSLPFIVFDEREFYFKGVKVQKNWSFPFDILEYKKSTKKTLSYKTSTAYLGISKSFSFLVNDLNYLKIPARQLLDYLEVGTLYIFNNPEMDYEYLVNQFKFLGPNHLKLQKLSEVMASIPREQAKKSKGKVRGKGIVPAYKLKHDYQFSGTPSLYDNSDPCDIDLNGTGIYFGVAGLKENESAIETRILNSENPSTRFVMELGALLGHPPIYGIKMCHVPKLGLGWTHISTAVNKKIEQIFEGRLQNSEFSSAVEMIEHYQVISQNKRFSQSYNSLFSTLKKIEPTHRVELMDSIGHQHPLSVLFTKLFETERVNKELLKLADTYELDREEGSTIEDELKALYDLYPLLESALVRFSSVGVQPILNYINIMNKHLSITNGDSDC